MITGERVIFWEVPPSNMFAPLSCPNDHGENFIGLLKIFGLSLELLGKQVGRWLGSPLEDHPRKVVRITPHLEAIKFGHLEGVPQPDS